MMWRLLIVLVIGLAACGPAPTQTKMVKATKAEPTQIDTQVVVEPTEPIEATRAVTQIVETEVVEEIVAKTMFVCGIDRCELSGAYGELIFTTGINVWENPDPNRGKVIRELDHLQGVTVLVERRVREDPGGLWFQLEGGGWMSDLWLTDEACTTSNLEQYSRDC